MDFESKGRLWVGNFYQKFETMRQEVDNIVNQDAVKFVENQVRTVNKSVIKICSDVVQIVDPVICEAQAVALNGNTAVGTYIKSIIGTEGKVNNGHRFPSNKLYLDPSDLSEKSAFDAYNPVYQKSAPTPLPSHQVPEIDQARNIDDVLTNVEENAMYNSSALDESDLIAFPEDDSTDALLSNELTVNENSCVSLNEVESVHCNTNISDSVSNTSTLLANSLNENLENIESRADADKVAAHVSEHSSLLVSSISAPIVSSYKEEEETGPTSSSCVLSMESTDKLASPLSLATSPIEFFSVEKAEATDMSLESTVCSSSSTYVVDGLADSELETIDLFDELKPEESCIIIDNSMLYEVVRRIHRQRSYKDLFNTRKRVSKEYEQLAIWCGDIDIESSNNTVALDPAKKQLSLDSEWELL